MWVATTQITPISPRIRPLKGPHVTPFITIQIYLLELSLIFSLGNPIIQRENHLAHIKNLQIMGQNTNLKRDFLVDFWTINSSIGSMGYGYPGPHDSWGKASNNRTNDGHNMKTKMLIVIAVLRIHVSYQKKQYTGSKHHLLLSGCVGKLYYN